MSVLCQPRSLCVVHAYGEGYNAGMRGMFLRQNPFPEGSAASVEWVRGFKAGCDRREVARARRF